MDIKKAVLFGALAVFVLGAGYLSWLIIRDKMLYSQYTNDKEGISMKYPKGWKVVPYPETGAIVGFVMPKANALVLFQANWNISATPLAEPLTLEQYAGAANAQMTFMFKDVVPSARPVKISGHEGRELVYLSRKDDGLVFITYVFIYKNVAYNITYADEKAAWLDPEKKRRVADVIGSLKVNF